MKIKLEGSSGYGYVKWPCWVCGEFFELGDVTAQTYHGEEKLGYVCPECIKGGTAGMRQRLADHIQRCREDADWLEGVLETWNQE